MKRSFLAALAIAGLAACSAGGMDKHTVVENGAKARLFVARYGAPTSSLLRAQAWPAVAAPSLEGATWHALPSPTPEASVRYSLVEQPGGGVLYLAREDGASVPGRVASDLEVFGPVALGDGS